MNTLKKPILNLKSLGTFFNENNDYSGDSITQNTKKVLWLGIFTYSILLLLALLYFKERTVILDVAYHLFHILKDNDFAIQVNRFGAVVTQVFPLLASKLNLPIYFVAMAYSLGFVLYYFITFLIILLWIKNARVALALLLFNVLMVAHSFYWIQCELVQGVAFTFLYISLVEKVLIQESVPNWFMVVSPFFLVTIVFFYPLLPFVLLFAFLFFAFRHPQKIRFLFLTFTLYLIIYAIKVLFFKTPYDSNAMGGLKNIITFFPDYFSLTANKNLIYYFLRDYYFAPLLLLWITIAYWRSKQFKKLSLVWLFFLGFCFIVNVSQGVDTQQFYIESQYLILSVFVTFPLIYDILPKLSQPKIATTVVGLLIVISLFRIWNTHKPYSNKLNWTREFLENTNNLPQKKLVIPAEKAPQDTLLMTWGSSYEFWLLSTMEQNISRSIIIEEVKGEFDWTMNQTKSFITKWGVFDYSNLNQSYFKFTDTSAYIKY